MSNTMAATTARRRPWLAGLLSLLLPGLGQLYNRTTRLAWPLLVVMALAAPLGKWLIAAAPSSAGLATMIAVIGGFLAVLVFAVVQAVLQARRIRAIEPAWFNRWYVYLGVYPLAVLVRLFIGALPVSSISSYSTPSSSMVPTLLVGDYLEAKSSAFVDRLPERGEIVLFIPPTDATGTFVKRVIGLPGDRVQWREGRLYLNDTLVDRRRVEDFLVPGGAVERAFPQYEETLPDGKTYRVVETEGDQGVSDNTEVFEVPAGHVFVAGDNRDRSNDSRNGLGFVPLEALQDKPLFLFWAADLSRIGRVVE